MGGMFHKEQSVGVIGQYHLLELLTRTPSTELYRARRGSAKEPLVLKLYVDEDPERDRRLLRAIQILLRLAHPAILPLQDWGTDANRHYLVTEPPGKPLEIPAEGATPATTLEVLGSLGAALTYLHGQGIVHRDVRPASLAEKGQGKWRLVDFALMRTDQSKRVITRFGSRVGTPAYMSPEQVLGAGCTPATDQYQLGVLAYQLLTGRLPFGGDDSEVMRHIADDPADVAGVKAGPVLEKMLAKNPAERYPSVAHAFHALRTAL